MSWENLTWKCSQGKLSITNKKSAVDLMSVFKKQETVYLSFYIFIDKPNKFWRSTEDIFLVLRDKANPNKDITFSSLKSFQTIFNICYSSGFVFTWTSRTSSTQF